MEAKNLDLDFRIARDASVAWRVVDDEVVLVPIRKSAAEVAGIYVLNEVAARVWDLLDGTRTVRDVRDAIVEEFEVEPSEAEADILSLLADLRGIGAVGSPSA